MAHTSPDDWHLKPARLSLPEEWVGDWFAPILNRFSEIEQVYILGDGARGPHGQKPDYSLLLYAGYDRALDLMTQLSRAEDEYRCHDGIVHLYVENYGATFCGIWGGALIPNELNRTWIEGRDYLLWVERGDAARPLCERLRLPLERRGAERRARQSTPASQWDDGRDALQPLFPETPATSERRVTERRRDLTELMQMLQQ